MAATLIGLSGISNTRAQTDAEVDALLAEALLLPEWATIATGSVGTGYRDNIFLSNADPEGRAFVSAAAELLVLRLDQDATSVTFFANGEARHYLGGGTSYQEYTAFGQALVEQNLGEVFTGTFAGQFFYQDQVLDVSVTETNRQAVPVRGETIMALPGVRAQLASRWWLELETPVTRQIFQESLDNYWEGGPRLTLGVGNRNSSRVTLAYDANWRAYDTDEALTADGDPIPGTHRRLFRQQVRLSWRQYWDESKYWRTTLTGGGRWDKENADGYSDYFKSFVGVEAGYRRGRWDISVEGRFANYDYRTQTVSATDPAKRHRTEWIFTASLERQLAEKLVWITTYEYEDIGSNDPLETYSVNTVSTALRWDF